jgi:putative ABC transport system ATP-binding protein
LNQQWGAELGSDKLVTQDWLTLADGQRLPLTGEDLYIGRAPSNDIVIDEPTVMDRHARLLRFAEGWVLADLDSGDGTAVNGEPVTYPVVLAPGDNLRLGRLTMTFQPGSETVSSGPPAFGPGSETWVGDEARRLWAGALAVDGAPVLALRNVVKTYQASAGPISVLRGVSLTVRPAEFVAIVGPSGCGKSTLLNMITGIDRPDAGDVVVAGQDILSMRPDALTRWRGRTVGIVFQFFQLLPTLTVAENVMLPIAFGRTYPGHARRKRAMEVLGRVGMAHAADRLPSVLSGGEQQRVAIARALVNNPPIVVADEPTGNLDSQTGRQIFHLFAGLAAAGTTVLMVTHDPLLVRDVPRQIEMADGRIVRDT